MRTITIPSIAIHSLSLTWSLDRLRRKAYRLAVQLTAFAAYCADYYSARAQYEELGKLSVVELERRGIAQGDFHRHAADAFPKWHPGA
jgi:hypothetical protein